MKELETVPNAIHIVLDWLNTLATTRIQHHETTEYQEAKRKSGVAHGCTGLIATEHETRAAIRKAKYEMRTATKLATQWDKKELTYHSCQNLQFRLLTIYWNGSLQGRLEEFTAGGNADPMCRTPSVKSRKVISARPASSQTAPRAPYARGVGSTHSSFALSKPPGLPDPHEPDDDDCI